MEFKLVPLCLTLLALTSAENRNISTDVGPVLVPDHVLQVLLAVPNSPSPNPSDIFKTTSMWNRLISPLSRMVWYLRQFVCTIPSVPPTPASSDCSCGIKGSGRIVGGQAAGQQEWPWQAYLLIDSRFACGGSLINEKWVVTASHCLYQKSQVKVFLGIYDITTGPYEHVTNGRIVTHPLYSQITHNNDIALVQLNTPATFSTKIKPICLPYNYASNDFAGQSAVLTGWGTTSEGGAISSTLLEVTIPILHNYQCISSPFLYSSSDITNNMFCMYDTGVDSCQGDSGGPVNWQGPSNTYLIGLVSFGVGCGRPQYPGVYTKVNNYLGWIESATSQAFCNL